MREYRPKRHAIRNKPPAMTNSQAMAFGFAIGMVFFLALDLFLTEAARPYEGERYEISR